MHIRKSLLQSVYAALTIFVLVLLLETNGVVIITSIGASAFIVFAKPNSNPAKARNLIGGQVIGLFVGSLLGMLPQVSLTVQTLIYALCVGVTIFLMGILDREHPPAVGTALGVVMLGPSLDQSISLVTSILVLAMTRHLLRSKLVDLV